MTQTKHYQVSIILVNYNTSDYTINCVKSVIEKTDPSLNYHIVVVDNDSRDEERKQLSALHDMDEVTVIYSRLNTGFSQGNMTGVQAASADYYFFLNNDCTLINDCIKLMYDFAEKTPHLGVCTPEMYDEDMQHRKNYDPFPSILKEFFGSSIYKLFYPKKYPEFKKHEKPIQVDYVSGSAMFVRAKPFHEIGGLDTHYFLYCEEEDLALRMNRHGYPAYLVSGSKYQHMMGKSTEFKLPILKEFYISRLYFYRKNYGFFYKKTMQSYMVFKLFRKFYRKADYIRLAWFVMKGAHFRHSLRNQQKIRKD